MIIVIIMNVDGRPCYVVVVVIVVFVGWPICYAEPYCATRCTDIGCEAILYLCSCLIFFSVFFLKEIKMGSEIIKRGNLYEEVSVCICVYVFLACSKANEPLNKH